MSFISEKLENKIGRRSLLQYGAAAGASLVGGGLLAGCGGGGHDRSTNDNSGGNSSGASVARDIAILNFALNLEYLEAEYYLRAVTGTGLIASDRGTGAGTVTPPTSPQVAFGGENIIHDYAREIANDEQNHVKLLRAAITVLGGTPVSMPNINLNDSFKAVVPGFDPYATVDNFILGSFVFEDVGVTAYKGAARLILTPDVLEVAAGFLAVEAYHAGSIRSLVIARNLTASANTISGARGGADGDSTDTPGGVLGADTTGTVGHDQGVGIADPSFSASGNPTLTQSSSNLVPTDGHSLAYSRTTAEVLRIVYLGSNPTPTNTVLQSFFPNGMNGSIK